MSQVTVRARTVDVAIRGPLERADLPGLYARICGVLEAHAGSLVACDVSGCQADAVAVEALARLQLGARRHQCRVHLRNAAPELVELVTFMGLADVLPN